MQRGETVAVNDIGIDLGTTTTLIHVGNSGIVLSEPSIVAVNTQTGELLGYGETAKEMVGKTPANIVAIYPMMDGVISDYDITEKMLKYYLSKVCKNWIIKPRIAVCIPSLTTKIESKAVIKAAMAVGARKVYLVEEPVAAAIGAGLDILKPEGNMIVDIGGGTTDVAVISLGGIVASNSIKLAGKKIDESIVRYIKNKYKVLLGEKTAEKAKIEAGSVWENDPDYKYEVKGRNLMLGLPVKITITRADLYNAMIDDAMQIVRAAKNVLEKTPPELIGDIMKNGMLLTGGGSLLRGLRELMEEQTGTKVVVAENAIECVAKGTGKTFEFIDKLSDGFNANSIDGFITAD